MVKSLILAVLTVGLVQPALAGKTGKAKVSTVKVGSKDGGVAGKLDTALKDAGISGITFKDVLIPDDSNLIGDMTASLTRLDNVVRADASNVAGDGNTQSLIDKLNSVLGKMDEESYLALVTRAEELSADKKGARDILGCRQ